MPSLSLLQNAGKAGHNAVFEIVNIPLHIFLKNLNDVVYWNNSPWSVAEWGVIPIRRRVYAIWGTEA